jgi:hypothetical protein
MVALEFGEHLLLYITAKVEVVSMVLVAERSEPKQPQALKVAPATRSGSQDSDPAEEPRDQEVSESQIPESTRGVEPQLGSRLPEVPSSPKDQEAFGSQILEPILGPDSQQTAGS